MMTKAEAHAAAMEADRDRARIAYAGIDFERWSDARIRRAMDRNRATTEYVEANERFRKFLAICGPDYRAPRI